MATTVPPKPQRATTNTKAIKIKVNLFPGERFTQVSAQGHGFPSMEMGVPKVWIADPRRQTHPGTG